MYSIRTQKRMIFLLYLMLVAVLLSMPFRYTNLLLHDFSFMSMAAKYSVVSVTFIFMVSLLFMYFFLTPSNERRFSIRHLKSIFVLAACVSIMGVIVGIANGNRLYYLVGDTFRHTCPWVFFLMFLWILQGLIKSGRIEDVERFLFAMAIIGVIEAIATLVMRSYFPHLRISTNLYLWGIIWALYQKKYPFLLILPVLLICFVASIASGKRSPVVLVGVIAVIYLFYLLNLTLMKGGEHKRFAKMAMEQLLTVFLIIIIIISALPVFKTVSDRFADHSVVQTAQKTVVNVYEIFTDKTEDTSWQGRWIEWRNIVEHMHQHPEAWLWGSGFGAEIEPYDPEVVQTSEGTMHNVHQAWAAYFLRSGGFGVILFFLFFAKMIWFFLRRSPFCLNWQYFSLSFIVICIIGSFSSNVMLETFGESFLGAFLYALVFPYDSYASQGAVSDRVFHEVYEDEYNSSMNVIDEYGQSKTNSNEYQSI